MWIFGRFLQCSAAGISQKRWGFVPNLGSSRLVNGGLKVESDLAAMTWFMWLRIVALTGKGAFSWSTFCWLPCRSDSHQQWPNRQGLFEGWWVANTRKSSRRWVAPFSRISKKRPKWEREDLLCHRFLYRGFWKFLAVHHVLHMTWKYPYSRLERWRSFFALSRRSFHPVLQLPPFVVLVGNCHPLVLQDNVDVSGNSGFYPQIIHFNRVFHYKPSILGGVPP